MTDTELEDCPLCDRIMIEGSSIDKHHLIPKSRGGKATEWLHLVCHRKIHSVFTESELAGYYHTWSRLRDHETIQKFIKWIQKKHPEFVDRHKQTNNKKRKRH